MTRVVFIEDGVYALHGSHRLDKPTPFFNLQEVIDAVAGSENLQLYCFTPSLQKRGITKNPKMIGVLDIGIPEFGNLLFYSPGGNAAGHQRVLFF
jgi:tRNA 2-thiouridine synthesizing protein C